MAYIVGLVTEEELETLRGIGWEDEDPPKDLLSEYDNTVDPSGDKHVTRMFFVDSNVYDVMTGPDWEQPKPEKWEVNDYNRPPVEFVRIMHRLRGHSYDFRGYKKSPEWRIYLAGRRAELSRTINELKCVLDYMEG